MSNPDSQTRGAPEMFRDSGPPLPALPPQERGQEGEAGVSSSLVGLARWPHLPGFPHEPNLLSSNPGTDAINLMITDGSVTLGVGLLPRIKHLIRDALTTFLRDRNRERMEATCHKLQVVPGG